MTANDKKPYRHICFIYDGTFEGLLTCVFEAYELKRFPLEICKEQPMALFTEVFTVVTSDEKAARVWNGIKRKLSPAAVHMLTTCWLSETEGIEMYLMTYMRKLFASKVSIELNFSDPDVLALSKIFVKVKKEAEYMRQFVRFQKTADQVYFAFIEPLYNVLPMVSDFFQDRFADQQWIIYDIKRNYALYYDLEKTEIVFLDELQADVKKGKLNPDVVAADEMAYQLSWKSYLTSVSIKERTNLKLQKQHMPKRFWKYLTEKQKG